MNPETIIVPRGSRSAHLIEAKLSFGIFDYRRLIYLTVNNTAENGDTVLTVKEVSNEEGLRLCGQSNSD